MTKNELKALGLTEDDVLNKLVDKLCERMLDNKGDYKSDFEKRIEGAMKKRVDEVMEKAMTKHILPNVTKMVDGIILEETNRWGERLGKKFTFIEYLVQRVDSYIREEVDYQGKPKDKDAYQWRANSTRIVHMINEHLSWHISQAMKQAMDSATGSIKKGLEEAAKIAINNIKVTINTKVEKEI